MDLLAIIIYLAALLLTAVGSYFIANTICQNVWKEKIPQSKLIGFASIFIVSFIVLAILMSMAMAMTFGR